MMMWTDRMNDEVADRLDCPDAGKPHEAISWLHACVSTREPGLAKVMAWHWRGICATQQQLVTCQRQITDMVDTPAGIPFDLGTSLTRLVERHANLTRVYEQMAHVAVDILTGALDTDPADADTD